MAFVRRARLGFGSGMFFSHFAGALVIMFLLSACGYQFAGSGSNRLVSGQTLWVSFIGIEADSPPAQTALRRALLDEGQALRGLTPSAHADTADLCVKGTLRNYNTRAISYSALDQITEYRLTIDVELELYRNSEAKPIWKGTLHGYYDYPASKDLALQRSAEDAALVLASHVIAQKFLMSVEELY